MKIKMTYSMSQLQDVVVNRLYCIWELFLDNVEAEGWTAKELSDAAEECREKSQFVKLACQFV